MEPWQGRQEIELWLKKRLDPATWEWLENRAVQILRGAGEDAFFTSFSLAVRKTRKEALALDEPELARAGAWLEGWRPVTWTLDEVARVYLLLSLPHDNPDSYGATLEKLFRSADLGELVALHKALPLLAHPLLHLERAREGCRSNIKSAFEAVAHHNPYPYRYFDEVAWNQMILKALFIESALHPIVGIEARANPKLLSMLMDYARERQAANRRVPHELWRCVALTADGPALDELERILKTGGGLEKRAAALSLSASKIPQAGRLLEKFPDLARAARSGSLEWETLQDS